MSLLSFPGLAFCCTATTRVQRQRTHMWNKSGGMGRQSPASSHGFSPNSVWDTSEKSTMGMTTGEIQWQHPRPTFLNWLFINRQHACYGSRLSLHSEYHLNSIEILFTLLRLIRLNYTFKDQFSTPSPLLSPRLLISGVSEEKQNGKLRYLHTRGASNFWESAHGEEMGGLLQLTNPRNKWSGPALGTALAQGHILWDSFNVLTFWWWISVGRDENQKVSLGVFWFWENVLETPDSPELHCRVCGLKPIGGAFGS